jgi:hypothetical protein
LSNTTSSLVSLSLSHLANLSTVTTSGCINNFYPVVLHTTIVEAFSTNPLDTGVWSKHLPSMSSIGNTVACLSSPMCSQAWQPRCTLRPCGFDCIDFNIDTYSHIVCLECIVVLSTSSMTLTVSTSTSPLTQRLA